MRPDTVLLASFGGPEGPAEVMPFLERVTAGRNVPRERLEAVAEHYLAVGGVSPINDQNRALLDALRAELDRRGITAPLVWGNRNAGPTFADALMAAREDGGRAVLAIATSAYPSYSGCRQYREDLARGLTEAGLADKSLEVRKARPYSERDGFVESFVPGVADAITGTLADGVAASAIRILFTTHSIPEAMAHTAGPPAVRGQRPGAYEAAHRVVAARVMEAVTASGVPEVAWRLVFQSRSGPPTMPWLEPDIGDALRAAADDGVAAVVVVPIGFVSDHMEVVWDLDHEARDLADSLGLAFRRTPTPGTAPAFVAMLVDLVEEAQLDADVSPFADADDGRLCSPGCCAAREDRPAVRAC